MKRRLAFGATLRHLRTEAGLSQENLGRAAGLERAYVGHLENGRRNLSLRTMWQLADALHVTPDQFFLASLNTPTGAAERRRRATKGEPSQRD
ncbi:helix-turn-helix domain-containing protein [Cellulomonas sp. Leaf395]|uniref:helix-turn-helix domain-containing protein n=1 Tax=Cellulomonas sp. Leaf395 TaxID=1736362 RepID=UPI001910AF7A|nr:helix-turn-helix transcriptional regulator [Cellulomonas sp. Leaf395]